MRYKYWELEIDGPDKTGKDLLCKYLCELSDYRFSINVRGIISQLVYARKYDRSFEYDMSSFSKNKILILLTADARDLAIRCKMTNEPVYKFKQDLLWFEQAANELEARGYIVFKFNTSTFTPYYIAQNVLRILDKFEGRA